MRQTFLLLPLLAIAPGLFAVDRDPSGYERILIPVAASSRPGPFGAIWQTELLVRNEAATPAHIFQQECAFFCDNPSRTCPILMCTPSEIPPRSRAIPSLTRALNSLANVGAFIYVNRSRAADVAIQLRIRDSARFAQSWGTEVPVVRDGAMRRGPTYLLDIPVQDGYRQHLRMYGASSPSGAADLLVRAYAGATNDLIAERTVSLVPGSLSFDTPARLPRDDEFPEVPAYGEISPLRDLIAGASAGTIRLEIIPLTAGLKYWAMVSITNNDTQHVTLITPQ